jgi:hypothetical protein
MNLNLVELDVLHVEAYQIKEVLKVIFPSTLVRPCRSQLVLRERHRLHPLCQVLLHSIIFQRALHAVAYRDCESELFDIAYVRVDSQAISKRVEDYAEAFSSALERTEATRRVQICVSCVERRPRPAAFGFFRSDDQVTWERWSIALSVRSPLAPLPPDFCTGMGTSTSPAAAAAALAGGGGTAADPAAMAEYRRRQQHELSEALRGRLEDILTKAASTKDHLPPAEGLGAEGTWFEVISDATDSSLMDILKLGFGRSQSMFTTT